MRFREPNGKQRLLYLAIAIVLAFLIVFISRGNRETHSTQAPALSALATQTGQVSTVTTSPATPATNAPGSMVGPGVSELIQLMQAWRQHHPNYHLVAETTGPDLSGTTEVFRFVTEQGTVINRIKGEVRQPNPVAFLMETVGDRARAYFPVSNQLVEIDLAEEAATTLGQVGWFSGALDATAPVHLARASFVESGPDYRALTFVFPGALFQMPQAAGDLFLTIRLDESGKALSLEQLTLGMRVTSKLTYVEETPAMLQEKSPQIPSTAAVTKKSFRQVLQEQANANKSPPPLKGKGISI